jgi:hypothetical protein
MKAGLVMNAFVLAAFQKFGGAGAADLIRDDPEATRGGRCVVTSVLQPAHG